MSNLLKQLLVNRQVRILVKLISTALLNFLVCFLPVIRTIPEIFIIVILYYMQRLLAAVTSCPPGVQIKVEWWRPPLDTAAKRKPGLELAVCSKYRRFVLN